MENENMNINPEQPVTNEVPNNEVIPPVTEGPITVAPVEPIIASEATAEPVVVEPTPVVAEPTPVAPVEVAPAVEPTPVVETPAAPVEPTPTVETPVAPVEPTLAVETPAAPVEPTPTVETPVAPVEPTPAATTENAPATEPAKEKKKTSPVVIMILVIAVLAAVLLVLKPWEKKTETGTTTEDTTQKEPTITEPEPQEETVAFNLTKGKKYQLAGEEGVYEPSFLILNEDNTYIYNKTSACGNATVGNYVIDGTTITLTETVHYGCDACFFKNSVGEVITATIVDDNTLVCNNETLTLTDKELSDFNKQWYVTDPVEGETVGEESYVDCTEN